MDIRIFDTETELSRAAADLAAEQAKEAVSRTGRFTLVLSGGRTPQGLYEQLALPEYTERIPWKRTHIFWADERCVPPTHPDSNFGQAEKAFLSQAPIPLDHIHRMPGEAARPEEAAARYEQTLRDFFGAKPGDMCPGFDLVILGVGADGHTASLFPDGPAVVEARPWVTPSPAPDGAQPPVTRLTLTLPVINASRFVLVLAVGAEKQAIVQQVAHDPFGASRHYPAARVMPRGELAWFVDAAAAPASRH